MTENNEKTVLTVFHFTQYIFQSNIIYRDKGTIHFKITNVNQKMKT